jgi:hypothetical protein
MAKLKLQPDPTFSAKVAIPVAGASPVEVEFTFRHRGRKELAAFAESVKDSGDADLIMSMATGWELEDEFNAANVALLVENYYQAPNAVWTAYLDALTQAKEKN